MAKGKGDNDFKKSFSLGCLAAVNFQPALYFLPGLAVGDGVGLKATDELLNRVHT